MKKKKKIVKGLNVMLSQVLYVLLATASFIAGIIMFLVCMINDAYVFKLLCALFLFQIMIFGFGFFKLNEGNE